MISVTATRPPTPPRIPGKVQHFRTSDVAIFCKWDSKNAAQAVAKSIGWPASSATQIVFSAFGQVVYVLSANHDQWLTRDGLALLKNHAA